MAPDQVAGLVLAGGRSTRMGREKALLKIGEDTLIEYQLRTLRRAGVGEIFLSLREDLLPALGSTSLGSPATSGDATTTLLMDEEEGLGPLAGIVPALARAGTRHLLVLAVDMPAVRPSLLLHLLSRATPERGVAPKVGGVWEPLCALYPPGTHDDARRLLDGGSRSPAILLDRLEAERRILGVALSRERAQALRSWNTPEDAG